ncbi:MAG: GGDEF domain-containing protein [Candidatus Falkowbacteria bacterium]
MSERPSKLFELILRICAFLVSQSRSHRISITIAYSLLVGIFGSLLTYVVHNLLVEHWPLLILFFFIIFFSSLLFCFAVYVLMNNLLDLNEKSCRDYLTGLYNRRFFDEMANILEGSAIRSGECVGCAYLDLDGFKAVNDNFGHAAGDELLREVADLLVGVCRRTGDILARMGGDEFAILISVPNRAALKAQMKRLQDACREFSKTKTEIGFSIGFAFTGKVNRRGQVMELVKLADMRMLKIKEKKGSKK